MSTPEQKYVSTPEQKCISKRHKKAPARGPSCSWSGFGGIRGLIVGAGTMLALFEPVTVAIHLEDVNVVGKAVEQCAGQAFRGKDTGPFIEGQIAGDNDRAALVALAEGLEQ